jgi:hypothetical protein
LRIAIEESAFAKGRITLGTILSLSSSLTTSCKTVGTSWATMVSSGFSVLTLKFCRDSGGVSIGTSIFSVVDTFVVVAEALD